MAKLKVYELAKEVGVDPQTLVEVIQRLGVDVKGTTSLLGIEEVRSVREYYRKNRPLTASAGKQTTPQGQSVTEKRVGATVIRRRAKTAAEEAPKVEAPEVVEAPVEVEASEAAPEEVSTEVSAEAVELASQDEEASVADEPATEPQTAPEVVLAAPVPVVAAKPRRIVPSIIKKVATEAHLSEKVGPKIDRPKRVETPKPATRPKPGAPGTGAAAAGAGLGLKKVKEVELQAPTETAQEASRRKLLERQSVTFRSSDYLKRELIHSTKKKKNAIARPAMKTVITTPSEHKRVVEMKETITVSELAKELNIKSTAVISKLMGMGVMATINQAVDFDTASLVATEFQYEVKQKVFKEADLIPAVDMAPESLSPRGPVVTIMGHVDHGKTSLLDAIRKTSVASGEAGGITQHVGAYYVDVPGKGRITFVDTPGHEAFTAMRARGAKVTDIVVLVVSATDGVMPQTLESVDHAKAAGVPIVVAINKIDLPDANPDRIKQTLAGHNLSPEEWGGDTIYVPVSAKTQKGIPQLLEALLLQAEVLELKANFNIPARGTVIESRLDKNRGALASVLVQHGKLKPGDLVVCGSVYGKVRAMNNDRGLRETEALPGVPVEILGLPSVPNVGDEFMVVADEKQAKAITESRAEKTRVLQIQSKPKLTLDEMMAGPGTEKELRIILKADVQGSGEAIREALTKFPTDKAKIKVLLAATGGITESDIMLAAASRAVIIGFNVRPDLKSQRLAETEGIELRTYTIIYDMLEDLKNLLEGLLEKKVKEKVIGRAEVRNVFSIPKVGTIAGSSVIDGKVQRGCYLRLLRDSRVIYEGRIGSLRRFKDDVKEVGQGFECGIGIENYNDIKLGDQFEAFIKEEIRDTL